MKFGTFILDTKLQNGIENQSIIIHEPIFNIYIVASIVKMKNACSNRMNHGTHIHNNILKNKKKSTSYYIINHV